MLFKLMVFLIDIWNGVSGGYAVVTIFGQILTVKTITVLDPMVVTFTLALEIFPT